MRPSIKLQVLTMKKPDQIKFRYYNLSEEDKGSYTVHFHGKLNSDSSPEILVQLIREVNSLSFTSLTADIDDVPYFDDFGLVLLIELKKAVNARNGEFRITDKHGRAKEIISLTEQYFVKHPETVKRKRPRRITEQFGEAAIKNSSNFKVI